MTKLINRIVGNIINENEVFKALLAALPNPHTLFETATSYSAYIQRAFKGGDVPIVQGSYNLAAGNLRLHPDDIKPFETLFTITPDKGIGNGELSLFWLFNFNKENKIRCVDNRGSSKPDLQIDGKYAEVKAYKSHSAQITLGKFKEDLESRQLINDLFGIINTFSATVPGYKFMSEINMTTKSLTEGVDSFKKIYSVLFSKEVSTILNTYSFYKSIKSIVRRIESQLGTSLNSDPKEITRLIFLKLISNKLKIKPGFGGYVININKNDISDIFVHKIPSETDILNIPYNVIDSRISVSSGAISLSYTIFD